MSEHPDTPSAPHASVASDAPPGSETPRSAPAARAAGADSPGLDTRQGLDGSALPDTPAGSEAPPAPDTAPGSETPRSAPAARAAGADSPGSIDGVSTFMGMRWDDPRTVRLTIRPELINAGGLLSGVVTYALVDYCMGSTLWAQTTAQERIATINIAINYIQTATEGEIVCTSTLDRRNRTTAVMRSEVRDERGRLLVSAIGSYTIFAPRPRRP